MNYYYVIINYITINMNSCLSFVHIIDARIQKTCSVSPSFLWISSDLLQTCFRPASDLLQTCFRPASDMPWKLLYYNHMYFCLAVCGNPEYDAPVGQLLIHGSWTWNIDVLSNGRRLCGGVIIGPNHVLTAAHCVW